MILNAAADENKFAQTGMFAGMEKDLHQSKRCFFSHRQLAKKDPFCVNVVIVVGIEEVRMLVGPPNSSRNFSAGKWDHQPATISCRTCIRCTTISAREML